MSAWLGLVGRRRSVVVGFGVAAFALAAGISALRMPVPRVHDEFSYLLAADTFSRGRLTNPTHPLWEHFETFHVIQQPTYMSKYPPLPGLFLAAGQLAGHPIVGAWLATGLAVAACCWMFLGWLPVRWAWFGAGAVALHHGIQFYWGQSYWGGALPLAGGALLFGAWRRLKRAPRRADALWLGIGVAILANSRPFEGLIACVPVGISLLRGAIAAPQRGWLRQLVVPAGLLLACVGCAMAYYNARVTGDPLRMPYQVHEDLYSEVPLFVWQSPRPRPSYRHEVIRAFYDGWVRHWYVEQQSLATAVRNAATAFPFYLTPFLAISFVALPWTLRSPRMRFAAISVAAAFAAMLALPWEPRSHFLAPVGSLLFVLAVQGCRQLHRSRPVGRAVVWAIAAGHVLVFAAAAYRYPDVVHPAWSGERARMLARLESEPGNHLVFVRYAADHDPHEEWVWNSADIESAKVVWVRSSASEAAVRAHFAGRRIWTLEADRHPAQLREVGPAGTAEDRTR